MRPTPPEKASTGIAGLDEILEGGLPRNYLYLIQGGSGAGKTTLGLQFMLAGVEAGETVLYITLSETRQELEDIAASHGWSLEDVHIYELQPGETLEYLTSDQTIFPSAEVELGEVTEDVLKAINDIQPQRAVFDSISEIKLLAETAARYRRQLLKFRQVLTDIDCTTLFINNDQNDDPLIHSLVHGGIDLEQQVFAYGSNPRRLQVTKIRGMSVRQVISVIKKRYGWHESSVRELRITTEGIGVGEPLREFSGVLSGQPRYEGKSEELLNNATEADKESGI